jgi:transcriptional regulator with XRE-family HTH domain
MVFFAKNLKYLRQLSKLSQEELALNIGLNRGNIASYENGSAEPKLENLIKIANFFNTDMSSLLGIDLQLSDQMGEDNTTNSEIFRQLYLQADNFKRIIEGFKAYHTYKISKSREVDEKQTEVAEDYVKLLDVAESFILHHYEVLERLKRL